MLFARGIVYEPLCEYVASLKLPTYWVPSYTLEHCQQHLTTIPKQIVFLQKGPSPCLLDFLKDKIEKVWILNTEQMTRYSTNVETKNNEVPFPFEEWMMQYVRKGLVSIMDYSQANLVIWNNLFPLLETRLCCFIPPVVSTQKTKDVVFVGDASSPYRQQILQQLHSITILTNKYGAVRDRELYQHRILLNIHFGPSYNVWEEIRCLPCILAGMIVVSEESLIDKQHPIYPFVVFAPYDCLLAKVQEVQANVKDYPVPKDPVKLFLDIREYEARVIISSSEKRSR